MLVDLILISDSRYENNHMLKLILRGESTYMYVNIHMSVIICNISMSHVYIYIYIPNKALTLIVLCPVSYQDLN